MAKTVELADGRSIALQKGDITRLDTDAIVNAANSQLARGAGVCGAIHAAGGPRIAEECRAWVAEHGPVATGEAAITSGGTLPAGHVIHVVGPVWHGGGSRESEMLASAYRNAIRLAEENELESVAFPSISTGVFGYPVELAAPIALEVVRQALESTRRVRDVRLVLFDSTTYEAYAGAMAAFETTQ